MTSCFNSQSVMSGVLSIAIVRKLSVLPVSSVSQSFQFLVCCLFLALLNKCIELRGGILIARDYFLQTNNPDKFNLISCWAACFPFFVAFYPILLVLMTFMSRTACPFHLSLPPGPSTWPIFDLCTYNPPFVAQITI